MSAVLMFACIAYREEGRFMVRSQLIERLVETHSHLPPPVLEAALNAILNEITNSLAAGDRVELRRFGSFTCRIRPAQMGRNPRTGQPVFMERKQVLHFKAGRYLLNRLNRPTTPG